jgi:mono/diheme cytochrome c family protein
MRTPIAVVLGGALIAAGAGCGIAEGERDLVAGKQTFVETCAACHSLERAGTTGTTGPDLDEAYRQSLADGLGRSNIEGAVRAQIAHPADVPEDSPAYMPPDLVTGRNADNVAAYVAFAAARPGEDEGLLAEAVPDQEPGEPAVAEDGVLEIPATAQLAYATNRATAEAGRLTIRSPNPSNVPHDIALEFDDRDDVAGEVVTDGGVSEIEVDVEPGEYVFYCTVEGHREGGMLGTLTVE